MNKDNAKEYLPIVQAMADGKVVQMHEGGAWVDSNNLVFTHSPNYYRIKPEPKLRPWRSEEVPADAVICHHLAVGWTRIIHVGYSGLLFASTHNLLTPSLRKITFEEAAENYQHSTDGGKTWHPCGILES